MRYEVKTSIAALTAIAGVPKKPSITGITRLETLPTAVGLRTGLAAPLADPLWLLARQWQFNEFQGEDAGTPLKLAFEVSGTQVDAFRPGKDLQAPWQPLEPGGVPIETRVEAEPVWVTHPRLRVLVPAVLLLSQRGMITTQGLFAVLSPPHTARAWASSRTSACSR